MRFRTLRATWVLAGTALLLDCGGGGGTFTPALEPADHCALLTQADAQTIFPTAGPGVPQINAETSDGWSVECVWSDSSTRSAGIVSLVLDGALTREGARQLDPALTAFAGGPGAMAVSGLGDKASYINNTGTDQRLAARVGS